MRFSSEEAWSQGVRVWGSQGGGGCKDALASALIYIYDIQ